jgi:hypothetical protein
MPPVNHPYSWVPASPKRHWKDHRTLPLGVFLTSQHPRRYLFGLQPGGRRIILLLRQHLERKSSISFIGVKLPNLSGFSSQIPGVNIIFRGNESQDFLHHRIQGARVRRQAASGTRARQGRAGLFISASPPMRTGALIGRPPETRKAVHSTNGLPHCYSADPDLTGSVLFMVSLLALG